jgi:hypothetical protein
MSENANLREFINHARQKGMDHSTIRILLLSAGWKEKDIAQAMTSEALELPVPLPPEVGGTRDTFLDLLTFAAAISVVLLTFRYINYLMPDPALETLRYEQEYASSGIRWGLAAILVAFPLFVLLWRLLVREVRRHPEKAASGIRRWLTYFTLLVAGIALASDLVTLVYYLLEGELSARFLLKVLAVFVVAGLAFTYFVLSLGMPPAAVRTRRMHVSFATAAGALVMAVLVGGIVIAGTPMTARLEQWDERKLEDLQTIRAEIGYIVLEAGEAGSRPRIKRRLPKTLEEVVQLAEYSRPQIRDPQTGEPYEYEIIDETHFRLCAKFNLALDKTHEVFWNHPAGRHCYMVDVLEQDY